ncbi:MAG: PEP-CTERM sorting domain-containing protein [Richelia sp. RM1_1_1]|nr:PEP-CTERM sorting domain-containing protein [Richelia sp. RM1_1_1]
MIEDGESFALSFITNRDLTPINGDDSLLIAFFYEGSKTVPEPSNVFAFALTMALGYWLRKRKFTIK